MPFCGATAPADTNRVTPPARYARDRITSEIATPRGMIVTLSPSLMPPRSISSTSVWLTAAIRPRVNSSPSTSASYNARISSGTRRVSSFGTQSPRFMVHGRPLASIRSRMARPPIPTRLKVRMWSGRKSRMAARTSWVLCSWETRASCCNRTCSAGPVTAGVVNSRTESVRSTQSWFSDGSRTLGEVMIRTS